MSGPSEQPRILRATAQNRAVAAYGVAPDRVAAQLPSGLLPDTHDHQAFVVLVGVQLINLRVLGLPGPGFRRVPAVELQVPVCERHTPSRKGTITLQAHVPRRLVAWGARLLYSESVAVAPMQPVWKERKDTVEMTYRYDQAGREQRLRVVGEPPPVSPAPDTAAHFLMDRNWRYGVTGETTLVRTRVERPVVPIHRGTEGYVTVQWSAVYGNQWAFLAEREPTLSFLAPDTPLTLRWREPVK